MGRDFRHVALTWRQVVAFLFGLAALILLLTASASYDNDPPAQVHLWRLEAGIASASCAALTAILLIWNHKIATRPNIHPDILEQLLGADHVFEMDTLHFWATGKQMGGRARVLVLLQNVYAGECNGRLQLQPIGTTTKIPKANVPLEFILGGAEVMACWRDLPVPVTGELSFAFDGFIRKTRSPRVRFKRRVAIRSESAANAMTAIAALGGHIHVSNGSRLNIKLDSPPADALDTIAPGDWEILSLWSMEDQRDMQEVGQLIQHLLTA